MKTQRMIDQELELISDSQPTTRKNKLLTKWLGKAWQVLVMLMTKEPEIRIWQSCDAEGGRSHRAGNIWWHIHTPATNKSASLLSEEELIDKQEKTNYSLKGWTKFGNF